MTLLDIKPLFDWLQVHPFLAGLVTFLITFFECLMILGFVIPGTVLMTALGTLIGMGVLSFTSIVTWAIAGAIVGDVLSFWVGYHFHERTTTLWPFRRYPNLLQGGRNFFAKHGGKSVFVGRFMGPIRAALPLIAGMVHMPYRQFLVVDIVSAVIWAPIYMLPGILLGKASQALPAELAIRLILFVVLLLLLSWFVCSVLKSCYVWCSHVWDSQVSCLWRFARQHPRLGALSSCLIDPRDPQSHSQLALALICIFSFSAFLCVAFSVAHHGIATGLDEPVYHLMRSLRLETLDKLFILITGLSPRVLSGFWILILLVLLIQRNFWIALHWGILGLLSFGLGDLCKYLMHIPRPNGLVKTPDGGSFPSGHVMASVSLLGFFTLLVAREYSAKYLRVLAYGLTALLALLVLCSRVYLTAHWISDVLGGCLLSVSIISGITLSCRRKNPSDSFSIRRLGVVGLVLLLALWAYNVWREYSQQLENYQLYSVPREAVPLETWWSQAQQRDPFYRISRFGRPVEVLNVQWAEKLSVIQQCLEQKGWHQLPKKRLLTTLYHLSLHRHQPLTPVSTASNNGKEPVLVMVKHLSGLSNLLILEFWPGAIQLSSGTPLWLGLVRYQKTWRLRFQPLNKAHAAALVPAVDLLQRDLSSYHVRAVPCSSPQTTLLFVAPRLDLAHEN